MASLLAFTQSVRFGGDDAVLIAAIRAWPKGDDWTVILNAAHPGHEIYEEELAGRARVLPADVTADGEGAASFVLGAASRLSPLFRALRPDAVLVSSGGFPPTSLTLGALLAARLAGVPRVVLTVHNYPNLGSGPRALWRRARARLAAALCDEVVSVSSDCAGQIAAVCGRPVRAILNGTAPRETAEDRIALRRELGVPEGAPLIGAVGALEARKGFPVLLDAFQTLTDKRAYLVIIGADAEPEEAAALRRLAGSRVLLPGYIPRAWRFAAAFDVCVMPSLRSESFGMSALDAMWAGKPVVASRTGGLPEVVADGETGIIVPPGDPVALTGALRELLGSPEKARRMGEAGRRRAEALFTSARMAAEYREVLLPKAV